MPRAFTLPVLADAVELFRERITSCLEPEDMDSLLRLCGHLLRPHLREDLATEAIRTLAVERDAHLGDECDHDWMQAEPKQLEGAAMAMECACYDENYTYELPRELPLPRLYDARSKLLEALCLANKGLLPHCGQGLQLVDLRDNSYVRFGCFQPVVFPLVKVQEEELVPQRDEDDEASESDDEARWDPDYDWEADKTRKRDEKREKRLWSKEDMDLLQEKARDHVLGKPINADSKMELQFWLNRIEQGFGSRFFGSEDTAPTLKGIVEEHWNGIDVDLASDLTTCDFCAKHESELLRQHCEDVFQPLKKFMVRHLKHVRYIRPDYDRMRVDYIETFYVHWYLDLIAGFTPSGVLCGVYLTDVLSPDKLMHGENLAKGAVDMHLNEGPDRILRHRFCPFDPTQPSSDMIQYFQKQQHQT